MGALYYLKQKLVDFANVIQENVSRTDTVPSSKVVYDGLNTLTNSLGGVTMKKINVIYGTPTVVGLSNAFRGVMFTLTSNPNTHGLWYVFTTNSGAATATSMFQETGTAVTSVTGGTNQITLEYGTTGSSAACLICFNGSITS